MSVSRLLIFFIVSLTITINASSCSNNKKQNQQDTPTDEYGNSIINENNNSENSYNSRKMLDSNPLLVFLGDSLTEGYQVAEKENYPTRVGEILADTGIHVKIINGGLSGDTTSGALDRLDWFLRLKPHYLFVALGANDGLRGLSLSNTYRNLATIIQTAQAQGIKVLLAGQRIPPNYGKEYTEEFSSMYPRLAKEYQIPLLPFLLEGVAGQASLNLADGIHPNPKGYVIISRNVADFIQANIFN